MGPDQNMVDLRLILAAGCPKIETGLLAVCRRSTQLISCLSVKAMAPVPDDDES
jgi:hypothetical protein